MLFAACGTPATEEVVSTDSPVEQTESAEATEASTVSTEATAAATDAPAVGEATVDGNRL